MHALPERLADIRELFLARGHLQYTGEPVSHLEHALQCAAQADREGAGDALISAALLHDLGHLLHELGETPSARGVDDVHEYRVVPFLRGLFPNAVIDAIQRHVSAKRYLCATRPDDLAQLSDDSKRSLTLQGGVFSPEQANAFLDEPGAHDAIRLRVWDDLAKQPGLSTPDLDHFLRRAAHCALVPTQ
jgi:phosphonate degradation associated HDIG domain protein